MLSEELATASNIKSRVNRSSVLSAITSVQQKLKYYSKTPNNGLIIYCGTFYDENNKEKKILVELEPLKPLNSSLYVCDSKFHTNVLVEMIQVDQRIGFIIIDGKGVLFGLLIGINKEILFKLNVNLPKKHGRGGQSALRFSRIRIEKRTNFIRKICELSNQYYIGDCQKNSIEGLIIAGPADLKNDLISSELFDSRLREKLLSIIDISYGGEIGFNKAIENSSSILEQLKYIKEKKIIQSFFDEIEKETGKYVYGCEETYESLINGFLSKIILWEDLDIERIVYLDQLTDLQLIKFSKKSEVINDHNFDYRTNIICKDRSNILDWIIANKKNYEIEIHIVTDKTLEGAQFVKGFGGIGGILKYVKLF
uniref:eRF1/Pelota-like N-terminal domain-containing protein n=1 Tax=Hanusia phi TaxID=3032 RepID=A0A6T7R9P8_9CRYP